MSRRSGRQGCSGAWVGAWPPAFPLAIAFEPPHQGKASTFAQAAELNSHKQDGVMSLPSCHPRRQKHHEAQWTQSTLSLKVHIAATLLEVDKALQSQILSTSGMEKEVSSSIMSLQGRKLHSAPQMSGPCWRVQASANSRWGQRDLDAVFGRGSRGGDPEPW